MFGEISEFSSDEQNDIYWWLKVAVNRNLMHKKFQLY